MKTCDEGKPSARIWLVGEAPGEQEAAWGRPFVGASGMFLNSMLQDAGIDRAQCFLTNVCHERPPSSTKNGKQINNDIEQWFLTKTAAKQQHVEEIAGRYPAAPVRDGLRLLHERLRTHRPNLVIALGNTALWALAGEVGITKWRGSILDTPFGKCIPTLHPALVLNTGRLNLRPVITQDLRRARREAAFPEVRRPQWDFTIPRSLDDIRQWFGDCTAADDLPLISDTEGYGRVDCIGFAADRHRAICIPFTHPGVEGSDCHQWSFDEELAITEFVCQQLRSRRMVFHNAIWDCQVTALRWGTVPRLFGDTQAGQHVAFPGLLGGRIDPVTGEVDKQGSSLSLSFCASMYCDYYSFWKDDGRRFDPAEHDEAQLWRYNCMDCVYTQEVFEAQQRTIDALGLRTQYEETMRLYAPILRMMFRGIRYDRAEARRQAQWFGHSGRGKDAPARSGKLREVADWIDVAVGCDFNPDSSKQMKALFYEDLALPSLRHRKTGAPTLDDAALDTIARRNPLLRPLVSQIQNYRTLDTLRTEYTAKISDDGRLRSSFSPAFVETFRLSSGETALGEGGNIQNIKRPDDD